MNTLARQKRGQEPSRPTSYRSGGFSIETKQAWLGG
jgi:hypothetical protein